MTFCTPAMVAAFMLTMHPGQVYMGDNGKFHGDSIDNLRGDGCYWSGPFKGQCTGKDTYRVTIEVVNVKKRAFRYTATVKMDDDSWKLSKVGRWTDGDGICGRVADKEMYLDRRKEL